MLQTDPCVYTLTDDYQIVCLTQTLGMVRIQVGNAWFDDAVNGVLPSHQNVHKITLPKALLDEQKGYTVVFTPVVDRRPYSPITAAPQEKFYPFHPVIGDRFSMYFISDTHSQWDLAAQGALKCEKEIDLLILGGDISAESKSLEDIYCILHLAAAITKGEKPVLYARGNHETRGAHAVDFFEYVGTGEQNTTYFTFTAGSLMGIVLDCGEDKVDSHQEYGSTVHFSPFRQAQTTWLEQKVPLFANAKSNGFTRRLAICHIPFTTNLFTSDEFDIEIDTYQRWAGQLDQMGIEAMISGHKHRCLTILPGDELNRHRVQFPVAIASEPQFVKSHGHLGFVGTLIEVSLEGYAISFVNEQGQVLETTLFD